MAAESWWSMRHLVTLMTAHANAESRAATADSDGRLGRTTRTDDSDGRLGRTTRTDRVEVEVVCGLVEQQQGGLDEEGSRKR